MNISSFMIQLKHALNPDIPLPKTSYALKLCTSRNILSPVTSSVCASWMGVSLSGFFNQEMGESDSHKVSLCTENVEMYLLILQKQHVKFALFVISHWNKYWLMTLMVLHLAKIKHIFHPFLKLFLFQSTVDKETKWTKSYYMLNLRE